MTTIAMVGLKGGVVELILSVGIVSSKLNISLSSICHGKVRLVQLQGPRRTMSRFAGSLASPGPVRRRSAQSPCQ